MINVTKTYLPSLDEYNKHLKELWKTSYVTNDGPLVRKLEEKLKKYLGVKNLSVVSNGTLGLQIAIKVLNLRGEIITTPFSYVATTSSIVWENCKPVFVDINSKTLCIDVNKIEAAITGKTSAILAVHVYGNVCDVEKIDKIAKKYNLKVIYDAAHAFGVNYKGRSVLNYGDISVLSFHATKVFHTIEGGALVTSDGDSAKRIWFHRNFGHEGSARPDKFLCILPKMKNMIRKRKKLTERYDQLLSGCASKMPKTVQGATSNYGYYPVLFESEAQLLKIVKYLNANSIFPRRYFYPSLNTLSYVKYNSCPISEDISRKVLCLPLYYELRIEDVGLIAKLILAKL